MCKVIQITDTHLFADNESEIFGIKSNIKFQEVIQRISIEDASDTNMIFLTGDISQDETEQSYRKLADQLEKFTIPIYWVPGNHDDIACMKRVFSRNKQFIYSQYLSFLNWDLIFINTNKGCISEYELQMLREVISASSSVKKIAIVMHHHPTVVGTPLVDNYILENRNEFWSIVTRAQVELIICGHVHGDYKLKYNNIMIESAPASCLQWEKGTKDLKIDARIGYKIYYFGLDGYSATSRIW
jgi:Icc protein